MPNNKIKAIIFDMGGVILRTTDRSYRTNLGEKFGKTYDEMDSLVYGGESSYKATIGEISAEEHKRHVMQKFNLKEEDNKWFFEEFWGGDTKDQELVDFIHSLKQNFTTALLSNAWGDARESVGTQHQFLDAFDFSVFSAEIQLAKPDPKIYHWILDQLKVNPDEAIFVDDFEKNILAANEIGIHGILFQSTEQVKAEILALTS